MFLWPREGRLSMTIVNIAVYICIINAMIFYTFADPTLNVLNISDETIEQTLSQIKEGEGPVMIRSYLTRRDYPINKVMDSGEVLWEAQDSGEHLSVLKVYFYYKRPMLAHIYTVSRSRRGFRFFFKEGYYWRQTSMDRFEQHVVKLYRERQFDIKNPDYDNTCNSEEQQFNGLAAYIFIVKPELKVYIVYDDYDIIWQRENEVDHCTGIVIHGDLQTTQLVHLHLSINGYHQERFMRKMNGDWYQVVKSEFYQVLAQLDEMALTERRAGTDS